MSETRYELFVDGVFIRSFLSDGLKDAVQAAHAAEGRYQTARVERVFRATVYRTGWHPCPACEGRGEIDLESHGWRKCTDCVEGLVRS